MTTTIVNLVETTADKRETYGMTYRSQLVYRVTGKGLHNPSSPHRVQVWDNTGRPNTEPDVWNKYSGKPGPGQYVDPNGKGTDEPTSYLLNAEPTVMTDNGTNTGTVASGQVYASETLVVGQFVVLRFPDGTLSDPFRLAARPLRDPELVPVS